MAATATAAAAASLFTFTRLLSRAATKPHFKSVTFSPFNKTPTFKRFSTTAAAKTISVGDKLPESTFSYLDSDNEVQTLTVSDLTKSKKTILFAVPGAFTLTCSQKHFPGFIEKAGEIKSKGVDKIACISVNDAFVMKAWAKELGMSDNNKENDVLLLSDGNADFTKAIGCLGVGM